MTLQELTDQIRLKAANADNFNATAKLNTDLGIIFIDGKQSPVVVSNDDLPADCTLDVQVSDLEKMAAGELNPMQAFMFGKLKVRGDMSVAMKMSQVMG
jgi:putative sterol carrier protein